LGQRIEPAARRFAQRIPDRSLCAFVLARGCRGEGLFEDRRLDTELLERAVGGTLQRRRQRRLRRDALERHVQSRDRAFGHVGKL
jgi:hypothetical protein